MRKFATTTLELQSDYWEGVGKRRTPDHPAVRVFARSKVDLVAREIGAGQRMLEVGCGNGFFSMSLAQQFELTVLDFSGNMLGKHPLKGAKVQARVEHLPFADDAYDVVFCGNLLHHVVEPLEAVVEMARVARKHLVLVEPNALNPLMFAFAAIRPEERGALKFRRGYLEDLGRRAGLRPRQVFAQGTVLPNKTPTSLVSALRPLERRHPLGFYLMGVFDKP